MAAQREMTELRDYQRRTLEQTRAAYRAGKRSICVVSPTGSGKTRLGVEFVRGHLAKGGRVLWLAHRAELVAQAAERLFAEGLPDVGIIAAGIEPSPAAPVQVASTQTLIARDALPDASLVVLDEAHHYVAAEWGAVAVHYASAIRLGLTATPERSDGKPLGDLFDALVVGATPRELTDLGHLIPCEVIGAKRYRPRELAGNPVDRYLEHAAGRRAFLFAGTVEHAEDLAAEFVARGVPAACVSGETPSDERTRAVAAFRAGKVLVLCNVYVFTEGTDVPEAEVCILARGCGSASTYLQMVGRVLRPAPGKTSALLLDLVGAANKHGFPADERRYSLDGNRGIMLSRAAQKKNTGGSWSGGAQRPGIINASLVRLSSAGPDAVEKREFLVTKYREAESRGYKPGWAIYQFRLRFGHAPWQQVQVAS